ncbi:MAG: hypothetical protein KJZ86_18240 [Caldilineaceae bacterium]|nr:hypothetical protein [Caldilineaceae bacterium]HRJ40553.1 hypothetical protein [Caldilineaceae bacterium]
MAEHQNVAPVAEKSVAPAVKAAPAPANAEKPGLLGQTPSMWFLIDSAIVLLIVLIMRLTAG